jgi:hypothetical protein
MKKIVSLTLLVLAGCTASEMPKTTCSVGKHWFRSSGHFNGYLKREVIEGRTNNANYKQLLLDVDKGMMMTRYAYDCEVWPCCVRTYIWKFSKYLRLSSKLKEVCAFINDCTIDLVFCNEIDININYVTALTKAEADAYLKEHPETVII